MNSRKPSAEGRPDLETNNSNETDKPGTQEVTPVIYSFMVEECILAAYTTNSVTCPLHSDLLLAQISPDTVSSKNSFKFDYFFYLNIYKQLNSSFLYFI